MLLCSVSRIVIQEGQRPAADQPHAADFSSLCQILIPDGNICVLTGFRDNNLRNRAGTIVGFKCTQSSE